MRKPGEQGAPTAKALKETAAKSHAKPAAKNSSAGKRSRPSAK